MVGPQSSTSTELATGGVSPMFTDRLPCTTSCGTLGVSDQLREKNCVWKKKRRASVLLIGHRLETLFIYREIWTAEKEAMIFIDGVPFSSASSSSQGNEILATLLEHPLIVSAANIFKTMPERKFSVPKEFGLENSPQAKHVYVFQREYATVDPSLVELVGTDEATTCIGLVIRNQKSGMTSVAHMDSQKTVDLGLSQMLTSVIDHEMDDELDVHLIGGFDDTLDEDVFATTGAESDEEQSGHSLPLCSKIIEALQSRREKFQIQTLFVLGHNTKRDSDGNACPLVNGFLVETSTGSLRPASFDKSSRCPDEIVRRLRVTVSSSDPTWNGRLLETYDTRHDRFHIAPCSWSPNWKYIASMLQQCSDSEILLKCSTSPSAEGPDFVDNEKRVFDYLIKHPNWRETFPPGRNRIFQRITDGQWIRCE